MRHRLPDVAGRIRDEDIAAVRERSAIDEVVGEYLQLRNAGGGSLLGLCPFHDEKSPSFHVTPARGMYFCFGCSTGGDVISFVQQMEQLSFVEAIEWLARRGGIELRYEQGGPAVPRKQGERARLVEAHQAAAEFYAEQLQTPDALAGRTFLSERGFQAADAERFGVGYAPRSWDALVRHLHGRGFTAQELTVAGLAREGRRGGLVDRFRGRLMWPIREVSGDIVGFGARRLHDDDPIEAKYLNTPETPLYKKGSVLYGVNAAKKEIARRKQAVVVEGYTDVMACHLAGVGTAVATCGTSFGEGHTNVLRRLLMDQSEFRGEVVFTFDGDSAGQRAALRAFADDQRFVTQTFVAVQPDGLDPCDLRIHRGDAAVRDLVARRVPLFEFAIRSVLKRHDLEIPEGRVAALSSAAPIVASIRDRSLRPEYTRALAGWLGMDVETVGEAVRDSGKRPSGGHNGSRRGPAGGQASQNEPGDRSAGQRRDQRPGHRAEQPRPDSADPAVQVEREVLKIAVQRPALAGPAFDALDKNVFTVPGYAAVRVAIAEAGGAAAAVAGASWVTQLRESCGDDRETVSLITALAVEPLRSDSEASERYAEAQLARLEELSVTRSVTELKSRLQRLDPVEQQSQYNRLFGELVALEQQRRVLRERAIGAL